MSAPSTGTSRSAHTGSSTLFTIYTLFALSGFVALIYEGIWARYLKLFLGHSSYGQILTLCIFMGGMGIGALLAARYTKSIKNPFQIYALIELLIGLGGFFTTTCTPSALRDFMTISPEPAPSLLNVRKSLSL